MRIEAMADHAHRVLVLGKKSWSATDLHMAQGMFRVYQNFVELLNDSEKDTLTGLMNRRGLLDTANHLFEQLHPERDRLVVMFADLDKFKRINDTHGHAAGDEVLKRFARILRDSLRGHDVAARLGGDEFVIILNNTGIDKAEDIARRIQEQVAHCAQRHSLDYSVTIGLGEAPTHGTTLSDLLAQVDRALYHAKGRENGGGIMRACHLEMS